MTSLMDSEDYPYRVFILRCWDENVPENLARFLLEIPRTGERYGFSDPERLLNALRDLLISNPTLSPFKE